MLICFICKQEVHAKKVKDLFDHLRNDHSVYEKYNRYACMQGQCCRSFANRYTYAKHIEMCHHDDLNDNIYGSENEANACTNYTSLCAENNIHVRDLQNLKVTMKSAEIDFDLTKLAMHFVSKAKSKVTSLNNVRHLVISCQALIGEIIEDLQNELRKIPNLNKEQIIEKISAKLDTYKNPFNGIETDYGQINYLKKSNAFVKPKPYVIGSKPQNAVDKFKRFSKPKRLKITGQYVSISGTIKALNKHTDLITRAVKNTRNAHNILSTFFDGSFYANHPLNKHDTIFIRLYGDDFEPANPLGSRKTNYKIGSIYYQFESLPSYMLSKTENMFLALCYHSNDVKEYGWERVLRPLINELLNLETKGIKLDINGQIITYKVAISVVTGDNLFLNSILGFVESFMATYSCRHCVIPRYEYQLSHTEIETLMRTVVSYNNAVKDGIVNNAPEMGIKSGCALNQLLHFHAVLNGAQDVMHDIFEGICNYDMTLICKSLIEKGYLSVATLNHRIQNFDYGYHEVKNKPPVIIAFDKSTLPFDAVQMWCFTRIVSLAVGDLIPEDDDVWSMYNALLSILDIILAPGVFEAHLQYLTVLINEYFDLHTSIFPNETLKNKHHNLLHYPGLIRKFGSLLRYNCTRFESKHQRSKKLIHVTGNYKNVPKTLAMRHQHDVAFRLMKPLNDSNLEIGSGSVIVLNDLPNGRIINDCLGNVGMYFELYHASWIKLQGTKYEENCCVVMSVSENGPVFLQVLDILVRLQGEIVWLFGEKLRTYYFDEHYHAWRVAWSWPKEYCGLHPSELNYFLPVAVTKITKNTTSAHYVALRHAI